ncbi:MAG: agmatine deiminase family protein [Phycisphaerales bacterium]|nr:agmatine deiminase family protein [Phycisphaerales bacterium]
MSIENRTRGGVAVRTGRSLSLAAGLMAAGVLTGGAMGQAPKPEYPEGASLTRNASEAEKAWMRENPVTGLQFDVGDVPQGTLVCPGEYAPMEGIIMAWEDTTLDTLKATMIRHITTTGNAKVFIYFDTASEQTTGLNAISAAGANMSRVVPLVRTTDSIWARDYGPRYSYEGDVRVISDHTYNVTARTNDNTLPIGFAAFKKHKLYTLPLIHGGGNYHLNSIGEGQATRLIVNENPTLTEAQIISLWQQHWGPTTKMWTPFSTTVDATQHIDMWMQIIGDKKVLISDWPNNSGSAQDVICDNTAADFISRGWTVARTPAFTAGANNTHYTYANMVICNNLIMVPQFNSATVATGGQTSAQINAAALATIQNLAGPAYTVVGVDCQSIVQLAGVMHCIVMHVPVNKNGVNPGVYVRTPNGGATYDPAQSVTINWISDDDESVSNVDVQFSSDGGSQWTTVASAIPDTGSFNWTVPAVATTQGRIRVVARDAQGNTGSDLSDTDFVINAPAVKLALASSSATDPANWGTNNGNGRVDPGETRLRLTVNLRNDGALPAQNISAVLSSNQPGVDVIQGFTGFADLNTGQSTGNSTQLVFSLAGTHPCGSAINCTLDVSYDGGSVSIPVTIATGTPGGSGAAQTFTYSGPASAIPDNSSVGSTTTVNVTGLAGTGNVADVDFRFNGTTCTTSATSTTVGLNHSYVGDLQVTLTSPAGTSVVIIDLMDGGNNSGNNFCNTVLNDSATNTIESRTSASAPFTGSFKPTNPLSAFNGQPGNGTWTLRVRDLAAGDTGSVRNWSVVISPALSPTCAGAVARCPADIAYDDGTPLDQTPNPGAVNNGVNEGDFNAFFNTFFLTGQPEQITADIADDAGEALPALPGAVNNGVNEGDYNLFFNTFFNC